MPPTKVIHEIRARIGDGVPLILRLSVDEYVVGGLRLEDSIEIVSGLQHEGIDALSVSAGNYDSYKPMAVQPPSVPHRALTHLSGPLKENLDIPVLVAGRIIWPHEGEAVLNDGLADGIVLVRALIADADWVNKVRDSRKEVVRPCVGSMWCLRDVRLGVPIECAVNAEVGHEGRRHGFHEVRKPGHVLVIGGGPAGMEAARVVASRGHSVTLWEKSNELGGQLNLAASAPFKADYAEFVTRQAAELAELKVEVALGKEATIEGVHELSPSGVILATGGRAAIESIDGLPESATVTAEDVLAGKLDSVGEDVVVTAGNAIACDVAEVLASTGKHVTVLEDSERVARDAEAFTRWEQIRNRFPELQVAVETRTRPVRWHDGLLDIDVDGSTNQIKASTVVVGARRLPNAELLADLLLNVAHVEVAGDCANRSVTFAGVHDAVHSGYRAGSELLPDQYV